MTETLRPRRPGSQKAGNPAEGQVAAEELAALADRFRTGTLGPPPPGIVARLPAVHPELHLARLRIPPAAAGGAQITVDGSADNDATASAAGQVYGSCAAIASDGRVLAAWFPMPPEVTRLATIFAEWEALALGTRLIARYRQSVTIVTDNRDVENQARAIAAGQDYHPSVVGGHDPYAAGEITAALASPDVRVQWQPDTPAAPGHRTAATLPGRAAHALAWMLRRAAYDGIDLTGPEHAEWLSALASKPPKSQPALVKRWLIRTSELRQPAGPGEPCGTERDI